MASYTLSAIAQELVGVNKRNTRKNKVRKNFDEKNRKVGRTNFQNTTGYSRANTQEYRKTLFILIEYMRHKNLSRSIVLYIV